MKRMAALVFFAFAVVLSGCVGNRTEVEAAALKIDRKPSPSEEAQGWARAIRTILPVKEGSDD